MPVFRRHAHQLAFPFPLFRAYATKTKGITWDTRAARFVAAAQTVESLPRETSLPEVRREVLEPSPSTDGPCG